MINMFAGLTGNRAPKDWAFRLTRVGGKLVKTAIERQPALVYTNTFDTPIYLVCAGTDMSLVVNNRLVAYSKDSGFNFDVPPGCMYRVDAKAITAWVESVIELEE